MNQIYFLNESVTNSDEYYNEGATITSLYLAGGAIGGIVGFITGRLIRKAIEKKKYISDYEKSDLKIRASLAALKYELDNVYIPVIKTINNANINADSDGKDFISDPSNIVRTIYKVYGIDSLTTTYNISEKLVLPEDIINGIADKVKTESSDITSKEDLDKAIKGKYKQEFMNIYNQYVSAITSLTKCTALYNCKSGLSKLKLYINKDNDSYSLYDSIISTFINTMYKTASDIVTIAGSNYIYLIGNKSSSTLTKTFNNKLYIATRASNSI